MGPDTVRDTALAPAAYWQHFLQPKIDNYWRQKTPPSQVRGYKSCGFGHTAQEPDLAKRFANTSIDWAVVEK
jgi:hypothetical protein